MEREILFRGKAIENTFSINEKEAKIKIGDWVYGAVIPFDDGIDLIYEREPNNPKICGCHGIDVDHNTVGQFTGLKDSDGQEIYEGDILTWRSIICEEDPVETWELPVTFYNGCFCLNDDFDMTLISVIYDSEEFGGVKIIGNIHEK